MKNVAIITRTKDRPVFLRRAIQSVADQTYQDYIHVIVNDGGDVATFESVINSFSADIQERIEVFHREEPSNAPDTIFNESIDRVDSQYFTIHDDDDTWHQDFLLQTVTRLDENSDIAAVVARTNKIIEQVSGQNIIQKKVSLWMPDLRVISLYRQCIDNQFTPIATLFRREAYEKVGKFSETLPVVGDWEFGVRLLSKYDADFIDPGYALANYHHRKNIGTSQDAVSSNDKHRYYTNIVMNSYLREELANKTLGIGYIMNNIKYNQGYVAHLLKQLMPTSVVEAVKRRVRK